MTTNILYNYQNSQDHINRLNNCAARLRNIIEDNDKNITAPLLKPLKALEESTKLLQKQLNKDIKFQHIISTRKVKEKYEFSKCFPEIIKKFSETHDIFFITVTFKKSTRSIPYDIYKEFFKFMRKKFDTLLLSNQKIYHTRPIIFAIPEAKPILHFHGILLVHKQTHKKFMQKCVTETEIEYIEKLNRDQLTFMIHPSLINPYTKKQRDENLRNAVVDDREPMPLLHIESYKIYQLHTVEDIVMTCNYTTKAFAKTSKFTNDDIIIESKDKPINYRF